MKKGISSLASLMDEADQAGTGAPSEVAVELIERDPLQPRKTIDPEGLESLAASIAAQGVIQPIVVRPDPEGNGYFVVTGERRWRAAQLANLDTIPVVIREFEGSLLAVQLCENLDRENVPILEEAEAVARLVKELGKASEVAKALGKKAAWVSVRRKIAKGLELVAPFVESGATRDPETLSMLVDLHKLDMVAFERLQRRADINRSMVRQAVDVAKGRGDEQEPPKAPAQEQPGQESVTESSDGQAKEQEPPAPAPKRESQPKRLDQVVGSESESTEEEGGPWEDGSELQAIDLLTRNLSSLLGVSVVLHEEGEGGYLRIDFADRAELKRVMNHIS